MTFDLQNVRYENVDVAVTSNLGHMFVDGTYVTTLILIELPSERKVGPSYHEGKKEKSSRKREQSKIREEMKREEESRRERHIETLGTGPGPSSRIDLTDE